MSHKHYSLASVALISLLSACVADDFDDDFNDDFNDDGIGDFNDDQIGDITAEAIDLEGREITSEDAETIIIASAPNVYRHTDSYDLSAWGGPLAILVVSTNPAQPFAPVYSWRTHTRNTGPGPYGYAGDLIGHTDSQGIFQVIGRVPNDDSFCGVYTNERFAVGSRYALQSAPIHFQIYRELDFSPPNPDCTPYW